MFGYRFSVDESEQLHLWLLFGYAMEHRCPVRVSFFEHKKDAQGEREYQGDRALFVKTTRTVEPYELAVTSDGRRIVRVVDRAPEGSNGPAYRTIRLDRVAHSNTTKKPLTRVMTKHGYLCRSLLDGKPLHGTKRQLTARMAVRTASRLLVG